MIRGDDRVANVLARDARLLDVFVAASPAFEKLRNAAMRKTMARLVTVEQAARIAGLEPAAFVDRLNQALAGAHVDAPAPAAAHASVLPPVPEALRALPPSRIVDLDVRAELRAGREPFGRIMDAVHALPAGSVLRLRAIFEPAPLYPVLAKRGFAHATERLADDDWRVWFHRDGAAPARVSTSFAPAPGDDTGAADADATDVIVLDVRGLEPPEPLERTLEALAALPRGATLVQLNVRVPQYLLPRLVERGFTYDIREQGPDLVRVFIRHSNQP